MKKRDRIAKKRDKIAARAIVKIMRRLAQRKPMRWFAPVQWMSREELEKIYPSK